MISKEALEEALRTEKQHAQTMIEYFSDARDHGVAGVGLEAFRQSRDDGRIILNAINRIISRIEEKTGSKLDLSPKPSETIRREP